MWWLARGEIDLPGHMAWLSPREREYLATIRFTKRRLEYLTRRWTAKHAVQAVLDGSTPDPDRLASIEIEHHPSGAPWVAVDGAPVAAEISITDRAGWAVCLVGVPANGQRIGIDLELVEPRSGRFVDDYLTPAERAYVHSRTTADDRDAAANLLWSAKEAALKVLQVGLRADTRTVEVTVADPTRSDGWAPLTIVGRGSDRFHGWWRRDGAFVLTVTSRVWFDVPIALPGSADLTRAAPVHSWVERPLA
jgi:4'-phosphopantetheinyl transferase